VSVFETLRESVDLAELAGRYTALKPSGEKLLGRCPLPEHSDDTPSFYVYPDRRFRCFGCGRHGDVTDLYAGMQGFEGGIKAASELAREYNITLPEQSPEAREEAQERRRKEELYLEQAQACHRTLPRHPQVVEWWEGRGFTEELRERFLLGANRDGTEAVIPYWSRGRVQGLIRRKLEGEPKYRYPTSAELAAGYRPLFLPGSVHGGESLVEGIVDALAGAALGESIAAVGSAEPSHKQLEELGRLSGSVYVLADDDDEGREAARKTATRLYPEALLCPPEYGEGCEDLGDLFSSKGVDALAVLDSLKERAVDALALELSEAPKGKDRLGAYRVAKERILPLLTKLEDDGERDAALRDVVAKLKLSIKPLRKALSEMVAAKVAAQAKAETEEEAETDEAPPEPGTERYERAMKLLEDRRLLDRAAVDMKRLGHVGELAAKKLALICAVSARSDNPIQPSTHAQSAAGKNFLWDTALSLVPPEMVVKRSGLSAKALFRTQTDLKGAVLYIQEVSGSEDAEYTIRVMQSDGRLEYEATEKMPDGSMRNVIHQTEGPTVVVQTTTRNHLHPENETRVFPIYIDESEQQTGRIVSSILKDASGAGVGAPERERIRRRWHDAIRLLEGADVVIPFADRIEIPNSPLRIRRDARRLIDVVRVIAWLHQHQRERDEQGLILATEADFEEALKLVSESLRRAWQTLTPSEEIVLRSIRELPEEKRTRGFKRRDLKVREVSDRRAKEVLKSLTDTGYLDCDGRQGPQGYTYTLAREAEKISLGISLRPSPDRPESSIDKPNTNGRDVIVRYRPAPDSSTDSGEAGDGYRASGDNGRNDHRPIETADLQGKHSTGRTGGEEDKEILPGRIPSEEEDRRIRRLIEQGMSEKWARMEVLGTEGDS
jgi:DNA primase